jgi:hypothetical protein
MRWIGWKRGLKFGALAVAFLAAVGAVVMSLWNWLVPPLFGWHEIGFWQAVGLLLLVRILVGGMRRPGYSMYWRRRMMERWEQMTPEEREKFRAGLHGRCGHHAEPAAEQRQT